MLLLIYENYEEVISGIIINISIVKSEILYYYIYIYDADGTIILLLFTYSN